MLPTPRLAVSAHRMPKAPVALLFAGAKRKVMTYNALNLGNLKKTESLAALAAVIQAEDPDVIAFQEVVNQESLERLNTDYLDGRYPNIIFMMKDPGTTHQLAFLAKDSVRVVGSRSHWQEQNSGRFKPKRDFLEATFETDTGYRFTVFNAHFRSMAGDERGTFPKRQEEAQSAANIVLPFVRNNRRVLVVGDFNSLPHTRWGKQILNILSLKGRVSEEDELVDTLTAIRRQRKQSVNDIMTTRHGDWLDRMLASAAMIKDVVDAYVAGSLFVEPWFKASDHLPVVTVIEEPDEVPAREGARLSLTA